MHAANEIYQITECLYVCLAGLVVVMAVVFVIVKAKVEPCICQSNRLENLTTISIKILTKIWEHFESHTPLEMLQTQVAN